MSSLLSILLVFLTSLRLHLGVTQGLSGWQLYNFRQHIACGWSSVITYDVITSSLYSHCDDNPWCGLTSPVLVTWHLPCVRKKKNTRTDKEAACACLLTIYVYCQWIIHSPSIVSLYLAEYCEGQLLSSREELDMNLCRKVNENDWWFSGDFLSPLT